MQHRLTVGSEGVYSPYGFCAGSPVLESMGAESDISRQGRWKAVGDAAGRRCRGEQTNGMEEGNRFLRSSVTDQTLRFFPRKDALEAER